MEESSESFRTRRGHWDMSERRYRGNRRGGRGRGGFDSSAAESVSHGYERGRYRPMRRGYFKPRGAASTPGKDEFTSLKDEYRQQMQEFHTQECLHNCHEAYCDMYHPEQGQKPRRKPERLKSGLWNYVPIQCLEKCGEGSCPFAHTEEEVLYHPIIYKTRPCDFPLDTSDCCSKFGFYCPFVHLQVDKEALAGLQYHLTKSALTLPRLDTPRLQADYRIQIKLETEETPHGKESQKPVQKQVVKVTARPTVTGFARAMFKVEECQNPTCEEENCLCYHSSDERRRGDDSAYSFTPCRDTFIESAKSFKDPSMCPRGDQCPNAHTLNEVYYHKNYYQSAPCGNPLCRVKCCPFAHESMSRSRVNEPVAAVPPQVEEKLVSKPENDLQLSLLDRMCKVNSDIGGLKTQIEEADQRLRQMEEQLMCIHCQKQQQQFAFHCGHAFCQSCVEGNIKEKTYICRKCSRPSQGLIQIKYLS